MIQENILKLTGYGLATGLIEPEDKQYTINRLLELFQLDELEDDVVSAYEKQPQMTQETAEDALEGILSQMMDYAHEQGILEELEKAGISEGDTVRMYGLVFDYYK